MKNELFDALFKYCKEHPDFDQVINKKKIRRLKIVFDTSKMEKMIPCKNCRRLVRAIDYEYEIFKAKDGTNFSQNHLFEESTSLRYRCPNCKAVQDSKIFKKEFVP